MFRLSVVIVGCGSDESGHQSLCGVVSSIARSGAFHMSVMAMNTRRLVLIAERLK